jgi:hypothetical protein
MRRALRLVIILVIESKLRSMEPTRLWRIASLTLIKLVYS